MNILIKICDLIADFMKLDQEHCYIYNQKWIIPKDKGLCVVAGLQSSQPFANISEHVAGRGHEAQNRLTVQKKDIIEINIFSYNLDAYERKEEILMALNSDTAQLDQMENGYFLGKIPIAFNNVNEVDGEKILYRYNINLNVISQVTKTVDSNYFDKCSVILKQINN